MSATALIDEVRAVRHQIAQECGNDPARITRYATEVANKFLREHNAASA